ncbi:hypothetical protein AZE42_10295 [Rhizopogon vesiculosus]|uniref:Uncharacterized protein n=1 Tax=Rhizopogon vesiculosus TaxID=180088 RepID=A0A1J8QI61_9AGAM|nr:hypothetical protein AZE42_10295 [Rhizopogon vesiculosus]
MTVVSNDPSLWSTINFFRGISYVYVACLTMMVYDWSA